MMSITVHQDLILLLLSHCYILLYHEGLPVAIFYLMRGEDQRTMSKASCFDTHSSLFTSVIITTTISGGLGAAPRIAGDSRMILLSLPLQQIAVLFNKLNSH